MNPIDWLLILVAAVPERPVDPVRVQKGMFLLAMSGSVPPEQRYAFEPYAYGPMSRTLYGDARALCAAGDLVRLSHERESWSLLRVTGRGRRRASALRRTASPDALAAVAAIRAEIDDLSFSELLERVYAHPEYAVRSVLPEAGVTRGLTPAGSEAAQALAPAGSEPVRAVAPAGSAPVRALAPDHPGGAR